MPSHADEATAWLSDKQRDMEEALAPLVEVNSYTENPEGGRQVGAMLCELFASHGVDTQVRPSEKFADHIVIRTRPELPNRNAVALVGHLDTVFPPGYFEGYRRDGPLARGPGVLDMKGGLVIMAFALKALAATGGLESVVPLRVVVAAAIAGSAACLVFEAGRDADAIITRRSGTGQMAVILHGHDAHAGNAHA